MKGESSSDQDETQGYKRSTGVFLQDSDVKLRRKERVPKCCVVGDGGTGKTSMMMRYTLGKILSDYQPTCFENYTSEFTIWKFVVIYEFFFFLQFNNHTLKYIVTITIQFLYNYRCLLIRIKILLFFFHGK